MQHLIKHSFALLFSLISSELAAHEPDAVVPSAKGQIEGQVYDSRQSVPVEFASIVVYNPGDSSMVAGGISDEEGRFLLTGIPYGEYYVVIQFIGYENTTLSGIRVDKNHHLIDLGTISLFMSALQLAGAEITADKMNVEYRLDRKVINVDQDLDATGNSAVQILEKAPSVRVDISGEVFLRGSSNFTVLIDGKPSVFQGSQALQQIPTNSIEQIEIITNPSVKYDPDGTAGIINIKLKKSKLGGLSGVVNATAGTGQKFGSDIFLNLKTGKFNFFTGAEWNDRKFPTRGTENRQTITSDTVFYKDSDFTNTWLRSGLNFKGGVDYEIDQKNVISLNGEVGDYGFGMDFNQQIHEHSMPFGNDRYYVSENQTRWSRYFYSLGSTYKRLFEGDRHTLTIYGYYSERGGSEVSDKKEYDTDPGWNSTDTEPDLVRTDERGPSTNYRVDVDYTRPLGAGKLESGYHFRADEEKEGYDFSSFDYDQNIWTEDPDYSKQTRFKRNIHSLFGSYSNSFGSFEYQVGLRGEYTYRNLTVINTGEVSLFERLDYFPSLHLSHQMDDKNQIMASFSRRIERPRSWYLEPYLTYVDEDTRRQGNPDLLPEYTDSYEIGYLRTLKAGNISFDAYYRKTTNKITSVQTLDPSTGILTITFDNLNNDRSMGVEGTWMYDITSWLDVNLSATYYNYQLDDLTSEEGGTKTSNNWDSQLITSIKVSKNANLQFNFLFESPTATAQGRREESYYTDITVRQDFFSKRLRMTLKVGDIFSTRKEKSYSQGDGFYTYQYRKPESPVVSLTLSYSLNNFKPKPESASGSPGIEL